MSEVVIDRRAFDEAIKRFAREGNMSAQDVLRDQMRIFTEKAVKVLPPESIGQGRHAIENDVSKVLGSIDSQRALKRLNEMFSDRFWPLTFEADIERAREWTNKYRNRRGRIQYKADTKVIPGPGYKFSGKMHTTRRNRNKIIREKQTRIGRLKAGWMAAAHMFGSKIPSWVSRNNSPGTAADTMRPDSSRGYVEAVNQVPYAGRHATATQRVFDGRVRALVTRIDRELFRLGKKYSAK